MYLCTLMVAQALFYGREQSNPAQDVAASFITRFECILYIFDVRFHS